MSLTRYTAPDSAQKIANATVASATAAASNSRRPNSNAAKTSRFFVHWPGRSEMRRLKARERAGTAVAGVPETAIGEEVIRATSAVTGYTLADAEKLRTASALGIERFEHGQQLGDRQQIGDALGQVEQFHAAALTADGGVGADDLAESGAIDVRHIGQIQHDLLVALVDEAVDLVFEQLVALAKRDLALQVEHYHVADGYVPRSAWKTLQISAL